MKYMGSKARISKDILPIILENRTKNQFYVEPFVGGCNLIDKVDGNRIGNDKNEYLISMFMALQSDCWMPPLAIEQEEYINIRSNKEKFHPATVGFVGFGCSYSGKWFGGYARGKTKSGIDRNYCLESANNILKQKPKITNIVFSNKEYYDMFIPENSIIYCDPPYQNTTDYNGCRGFNNLEFWEWVRQISKNNSVFVSEYTAPEDFKCLWSKAINSSLTKKTGSKQGVEKLFKYRG